MIVILWGGPPRSAAGPWPALRILLGSATHAELVAVDGGHLAVFHADSGVVVL